jgi:hypothetical protein
VAVPKVRECSVKTAPGVTGQRESRHHCIMAAISAEKDSHDEIEGSTSVNSIERPNRCSNGLIWVDGTETCHHRRRKHEYDWNSIDFVKLSDTLPPKSFMEIPNDIGATFDAA